MKHGLILILILLNVFTSCKKTAEAIKTKRGVISKNAMVVSARVEASEIGLDILKKGGNAFDAMIATEMALAVAYPYAGNLGGGGFMVYRKANGETGVLDYREKAPLAATKNMYLDKNGNVIPDKSTLGAMAIGVPGTVAGVFAVHQKLGSLPMEEILKPVIELAYKGVVVTQKQEDRIREYQPLFPKVNKDSIPFDRHWQTNDTIKYPILAKTMERILQNGKDEFYKGETAKKLVDFVQEHGGIITEHDLAKYEAKWRNTIRFTYDDLTIYSVSPPSSGGICLGQIMKMVEPFPITKYGHNSLKTIQVVVEAERRAYADRSFYLGDPDFVEIPEKILLNESYLSKRMADFTFENATKTSNISHGNIEIIDSNETTHYSIVDPYGNAIAATTTLNGAYGSKLYCSELGFFLNNEMDDFSSKPGEPNMFGLIGAEANSVVPEKRMLSAMTPTIVEKNDAFYMSLGTPGGSTIITSVLQTILNVHEFGMSMQEAVDAPRFHHQWLPDEIRMEPHSFNASIKAKLEKKGYSINEEHAPIIGRVNGILVLEDEWYEGGADYRGDDTAVGF